MKWVAVEPGAEAYDHAIPDELETLLCGEDLCAVVGWHR